jgi:hypothetical protein
LLHYNDSASSDGTLMSTSNYRSSNEERISDFVR